MREEQKEISQEELVDYMEGLGVSDPTAQIRSLANSIKFVAVKSMMWDVFEKTVRDLGTQNPKPLEEKSPRTASGSAVLRWLASVSEKTGIPYEELRQMTIKSLISLEGQ